MTLQLLDKLFEQANTYVQSINVVRMLFRIAHTETVQLLTIHVLELADFDPIQCVSLDSPTFVMYPEI